MRYSPIGGRAHLARPSSWMRRPRCIMPTMRNSGWATKAKKAIRPVVVVISLSLPLVCAATAQELLSFHGRVLFVAGTTMGFAPDSGSSFEVDLTRVDQRSYEFLNNG